MRCPSSDFSLIFVLNCSNVGCISKISNITRGLIVFINNIYDSIIYSLYIFYGEAKTKIIVSKANYNLYYIKTALLFLFIDTKYIL